jgi:DNA repair ATPase RecN
MDDVENNGLVGHPITNMLMRQAQAGDNSEFGQAAEAARAPEDVGSGDQVDETVREAAEAFDEFELMLEGVRDEVVRRLDQFDDSNQRLIAVEGKLDQLLSHFGLLNTGS